MTTLFENRSVKNKIIVTLLIACTYVLVGLLSLEAAIPPGFATVVWPAAGVALLAVLLAGPESLIGVTLGATVLHYFISLHYLSVPPSLGISLIMGTFAMCQALVGRILILSSEPLPLNFSRPKVVLKVLVLGGLVSALTNATLSNIFLWFQGVINDHEWFKNWVTWYVGDAIGIVFTVPWLLLLFPKLMTSFVSKGRFVLYSLGTIAFFTVLLGMLVINTEKDKHRSEMAINTDVLAKSLTAQLDKIENVLSGIAGFVRIQEQVVPNEFGIFTQALLRNNNAIHGLSWNERIEQQELAAFDKKLKALYRQHDESIEFQVKGLNASENIIPYQANDIHVVVTFIAPLMKNLAALGLDVYSQSSRREALDKAWASHQMYPTAPISLVQDTKKQPGVLLFLPAGELPLSKHSGYATAVIRVGDMLDNAFGEARLDTSSLVLFDPGSEGEDAVLYADGLSTDDIISLRKNWSSGAGPTGIGPTSEFPLLEVRHVAVGGHYWVLMQASKSSFLYQPWGIHLLLAGAVLFAGLLGWFVIIVAGHTDDIEFEVDRRTKDLTQANLKLQASEQAQAEAVKEAERSSRAKSEFLANMSHEIRTPLNAILGLSRLGLNQSPPELFKEKFRKICHSGELLLAIINDILDFSKIEAQKLELEQNIFSIKDIVDQLRDLFAEQAAAKHVDLSFRFEGKLYPWLVGDSLRFRQILVNLLSNAVKFTSKGHIIMTCRVDAQSEWHCDVIVTVADTGIGMTEYQQQVVFNAFTQADTSTSRKFGGTGLGMTISHRLCQAMHGDISVSSEQGVGTTFTVKIPMILPGADVIAAYKAEKQAAENHRQGSLAGHILVVEDNEINQEVVGEQLRHFGLQVTMADNGALAVASVRRSDFDLILMDIQMPVMDGYQATRQIRDLGKDLPIIALTAAAMVEDKQKALECGMNDHLSKPIRQEEVFEKLAKWLKASN